MVQPRTPDRYTAGRLAVWRGGDGPNFSLKRRPRFHLAPRVGQNGASPGFRAIQHGQCALGALEGRFWLPGRCVRIGGRAPAHCVRPSAMEARRVRNGQLPSWRSLLTTPSPDPHVTPMGRDQSVCADSPGRVRVGPIDWLGRLKFVSKLPTPEEGDFGILEAATGSPAAGSGGRWAPAGLGVYLSDQPSGGEVSTEHRRHLSTTR